MFGKNRVVTPKAFAQVARDTLHVTSIFLTLQGEGPFAGETAIFIRLTGCNLQCSFCDTYFDQGDMLNYNAIFEQIENLLIAKYGEERPLIFPKGILLVITGGEPMMQINLVGFLGIAHMYGFRTQIESNGAMWIPIPANTHLVISPKINEKTKQYVRLNDQALHAANTMKFVISADMEGYQDIPKWAHDWRARPGVGLRRIYVSPMNTYQRLPVKLGPDGTLAQRSEQDERISFWEAGLLDHKTNQRNHEHAAAIAMRHGAILTLQQHLYANLP